MRWLARAGLALIALAGCAAEEPGAQAAEPTAAAAEHAAAKPSLLVLSSLPLRFAGGFSLEAAPSPLHEALSERFDVKPIDASDAAMLAGHDLLLMAHPLAQTPENLVALDTWVRGGGKVLLLADADFASGEALPGPLDPPPFFADTGLLGRWGLELRGGAAGERLHPARGGEWSTRGAGELVASAETCVLSNAGFEARCTVGDGQVDVLADADLAVIEGPAGDANRRLLTERLEDLAGR